MSIREIDPTNQAEIGIVAQRMRDTLIEVEGESRGTTMYSLQWLEDRLRWHLNPANTTAQVLVAISESGSIIGHTIYRIESQDLDSFGLISTTYVLPSARKSGLAASFLSRAHEWFKSHGISTSCTWTSSTNTPLIALYKKFGYEIVDEGPNDLTGTTMIKLGVSPIPGAT
jgi:GNAT superfamily N-acetyltransferase